MKAFIVQYFHHYMNCNALFFSFPTRYVWEDSDCREWGEELQCNRLESRLDSRTPSTYNKNQVTEYLYAANTHPGNIPLISNLNQVIVHLHATNTNPGNTTNINQVNTSLTSNLNQITVNICKQN